MSFCWAIFWDFDLDEKVSFLVSKTDKKPRFSNPGPNVHRNRSGGVRACGVAHRPVWWPHRPLCGGHVVPVWDPHSPNVRPARFGPARPARFEKSAAPPRRTHTRKIAILRCGGQCIHGNASTAKHPRQCIHGNASTAMHLRQCMNSNGKAP